MEGGHTPEELTHSITPEASVPLRKRVLAKLKAFANKIFPEKPVDQGRRNLLKVGLAVIPVVALGAACSKANESERRTEGNRVPESIQKAREAMVDVGIYPAVGEKRTQSGFLVRSKEFPNGIALTRDVGLLGENRAANLKRITTVINDNSDESNNPLTTLATIGKLTYMLPPHDVDEEIPLDISSRDIKEGMELWNLNFGQKHGHKARNVGVDDPATSRGKLISYEEDLGRGVYLVKDYFEKGKKVSRNHAPEANPQAVGGAILDVHGDVVGVVTGTISGTIKELEEKGINMPRNLDPDGRYTVSTFRRITPDTIGAFEERIKLQEQVLKNPKISFTIREKCDPERDVKQLTGKTEFQDNPSDKRIVEVDPELLRIMNFVADAEGGEDIEITALVTGHRYWANESRGIPSDHTTGKGFDIAVNPNDPKDVERARRIVARLLRHQNDFPFKQVISSFGDLTNGSNFIAIPTHRDHIHIAVT